MVLGTPNNPMTAEPVEEKADDLMAPVIGAEKSAGLIDALRTIEALNDVTALRELWRG